MFIGSHDHNDCFGVEPPHWQKSPSKNGRILTQKVFYPPVSKEKRSIFLPSLIPFDSFEFQIKFELNNITFYFFFLAGAPAFYVYAGLVRTPC